jgi:hypothetical protein
MGNLQSGPEDTKRLPYQSRPETDALARRAQERAAAELYAYQQQAPVQAADLEQRPVYEWVLRRAAKTTRGIARIDLVRPRIPELSSDGPIWRAGAGDGRVGYPSVRGGRDAYSRMHRTDFGGSAVGAYDDDSRWGGLARGARIKLTRCIELGGGEVDSSKLQMPASVGEGQLSDGLASPGILGKVASSFKPQPAYRTWGAVPRKAPLVSLGLGGALELDRGGLTPAMRIRFQDWLTVKFLPQPVLKLQKSLRLPNSPLSLRMRYECPLEALDDPFRPPARFMFRLDNMTGTGVHLNLQGVNFDQRVISLGKDTSVRFAGHANFPRQLPAPEGKPLLDWDVERLGLKTSW